MALDGRIALVRLVVRWLLPGGLVVLATVATLLLGQHVSTDLAALIDRYRWPVYALALALALAFHRSRLFIAALGVALVDLWASRAGAASPALALGGGALVLYLGVLTLARDRGVLSLGGLLQLAIAALAAAPLALVALGRLSPAVFEAVGVPGGPVASLGFAPVTQTLGGIGLALSAYGVYRWRGSVERSLVWTQLLVLAGAAAQGHAPLFLMAGGLTLGVSVLETSYAMAYIDELTGLPGRRSLMRDLDGLMGTYTLAMVDVDHFKAFNDRYGHDVGDQVLKLVATRLARAPGGAKAYRYGGEEFTLLVRGRTADQATPILEDVRESVEAARFTLRSWNRPRTKPEANGGASKKRASKRGKKLAVTVSIGSADSVENGGSPDAVLKQADAALYRAKRNGRNRLGR
jgi:diguanylate cyclase (GGDEF)-like protein